MVEVEEEEGEEEEGGDREIERRRQAAIHGHFFYFLLCCVYSGVMEAFGCNRRVDISRVRGGDQTVGRC